MRVLSWTVLLLALSACGDQDGIDGSLAGTYVLDAQVFAKDALRRRQDQGQARIGQQSSTQRRVLEATWRQAAQDEARRTALELILRADGRFVTRYRFGGEQSSSSGTWARADDRVILTTHAEKGRRLEKPYESAAPIQGDTLRWGGPRVPIPFTLRRRRP